MSIGKQIRIDRDVMGYTRDAFSDILKKAPDQPPKERKNLGYSSTWLKKVEGNQIAISSSIKKFIARHLNQAEDRYLIEKNYNEQNGDHIAELIIEHAELLGDCHLYVEPATFGITTSFSPQMLELYFRFLTMPEHKKGKLIIILRDNKFKTMALLYLMTHLLESYHFLSNKDLDLTKLRLIVESVLFPFRSPKPIHLKSLSELNHKKRLPPEKVFSILNENVIIYALNGSREVIRHNPVSFYKLMPITPSAKDHTFYSLGTHQFDSLFRSHHTIVSERFDAICSNSLFQQIKFTPEILNFLRYRLLEGKVIPPSLLHLKDLRKLCEAIPKQTEDRVEFREETLKTYNDFTWMFTK